MNHFTVAVLESQNPRPGNQQSPDLQALRKVTVNAFMLHDIYHSLSCLSCLYDLDCGELVKFKTVSNVLGVQP